MPTTDEIIKFLGEHQMTPRGDPPWPSFNPQNFDRFPLDWDALFPTGRRFTRDGEYEWEISGDGWTPELGEEFQRALQEAVSASRPSEQEVVQMAESNRWDACAWYQPIHFPGKSWGIYIRQDCILSQALRIARFLQRPVRPTPGLARALIRASVYTYFLHEQYHHKVESLAVRLEVVELRPIFRNYYQNVYGPALGTDDQLEEALANASAYHRLPTDPYERWISDPIVEVARNYLRATFPHEPPGYRTATKYLGGVSFDGGENLLHSRVHEACLKPKQAAGDWAIATRLIQSLFKVTDDIWVLVTPGGRCMLPSRQPWP